MNARPEDIVRSIEEDHVFTELRRVGGFATDADAVRTAIWKFAQHYDIPMSIDCFAVGQQLELFEGQGIA